MIATWESTCLTARERLVWAAAVVQSYYALRSGYTSRVRREDLRRTLSDGWLLEWRQPHKTRHGDPLRPSTSMPAQSSAARGAMLDRALALAAPSGLLFPTVSAADVTAWLRARVPTPPAGFVVSAHGIRAGTDVALQCLGVPDDIIAQWGWWSRIRRMTGYYGASAIAVCLVASELMTSVHIVSEAPGWYDVLGELPAIPDWSKLRRVAQWEQDRAVPVAAAPLSPSDDDDSDEDTPGRRPPPALRGRLRYCRRAPKVRLATGVPPAARDGKRSRIN
jgi:hypothetical protein